MAALFYTPLPHRALVKIGGEDRQTFLQGLVSADVPKADGSRALYGALLTPQGKFLHELFIAGHDDALLLETDAARRADLVKKLSMYKLRAKVTVAVEDGLQAYALWGEGAASALGLPAEAGSYHGGLAFHDPRLAEAGFRAWLANEDALAAAGFVKADFAVWDQARIRLGLPDGVRDLEPEKSLLLENGFDELNGVDFEKGCYMGQELTARTKYRALIKKRLLPVTITGPAPKPGAPILAGEVEAGEMRSSCGEVGLALLRLEHLTAGANLTAGNARISPTPPEWMVLPA